MPATTRRLARDEQPAPSTPQVPRGAPGAPSAGLRLGAFEAHRLIGRGGMGEVWKGLHVAQGLPVAIKLIAPMAAAAPDMRLAFAREVRALGGLCHPRIVRVLDYGELPPSAVRLGIPGTPYVVMEHAGGGSLAGHQPTSFGELADILDALLDALGHAHGRGVVHRDLKPGNVLVAGPADARPGLKLTDFGLAFASDRFADFNLRTEGQFAGTPGYMAPEQLRNRWRDFGPWTDLYALGCLGWQLATGRVPFSGRSLLEVAGAHLNAPLPPLTPSFPTPRGFGPWLSVLLRKDPAARYQAAAHARADLDSLRGQPLLESDTQPNPAAGSLRVAATCPNGPMAVGLDREQGPVIRPRLPPWARDASPAPSLPLAGAGLGLFGLRQIPLLGREEPQRQLWTQLQRTRRTGRPAAVVLRGPTGVGKTRLASWLGARVLELGAGTTLLAGHTEGGGRSGGLPGMLSRHLRCAGLGPERLARRLDGLLPGDEPATAAARQSLRHLLAREPTTAVDVDSRCDAVRVVLKQLTASGSVVVVIDDAQWAEDAVRFVARALLAGETLGSVLFVLGVREDRLTDRPEVAALLEGVQASRDVQVVPLEPLPGAALRQVVHHLLPLRDGLVDAVTARAAGNPRFATELLGDWVRQGRLVFGDDGFSLAGPGAELPRDLGAVWTARVDRLVATLPRSSTLALERAAVLGPEVATAEWAESMRGDPTDLDALLAQLVRQALATATDDGFVFAHPMLREAILRRAQDAYRMRLHHLRVAAMLLRIGPDVRAERAGRHLLAAGQPGAAAPYLLAAARRRSDEGDLNAVLEILDRLDEALLASGEPRPGAQQLEADALRLETLFAIPALGRCVELALAVAGAAQRAGDPGLEFDAMVTHAAAAHQSGETQAATELLDRAEALIARTDHARLGRLHSTRAAIADRRGDWPTAEQALRRSIEHAREAGDTARLAGSLRLLGRALHAQGDPAEAVRLTRQALQLSRGPGGQLARAHCLNALGEYARTQRDAARAAVYYRSAIRAYNELGSRISACPRLNLTLLLLHSGRPDDAWLELERAQHACRASGDRFLSAACHPVGLAIACLRGDPEAFLRHLTGAEELLLPLGVRDADLAAAADLATSAPWSLPADQVDRARALADALRPEPEGDARS